MYTLVVYDKIFILWQKVSFYEKLFVLTSDKYLI